MQDKAKIGRTTKWYPPSRFISLTFITITFCWTPWSAEICFINIGPLWKININWNNMFNFKLGHFNNVIIHNWVWLLLLHEYKLNWIWNCIYTEGFYYTRGIFRFYNGYVCNIFKQNVIPQPVWRNIRKMYIYDYLKSSDLIVENNALIVTHVRSILIGN